MVVVLKILKRYKIDLFVEQLGGLVPLLEQKTKFKAACQAFEKMKQVKGFANLEAVTLKKYCLQAEQALGIVLTEYAFIVQYTLFTIKNIEIIKVRHQPVQYLHKQVRLDTVTVGVEEKMREYKDHSDNNAVVLLKSAANIADYLNLSPFLIDESAFLGNQKSTLFFYNFNDNQRFIYEFVNNTKDFLVVSDEKYRAVKEEFSRFQTVLFQKKEIGGFEVYDDFGGVGDDDDDDFDFI